MKLYFLSFFFFIGLFFWGKPVFSQADLSTPAAEIEALLSKANSFIEYAKFDSAQHLVNPLMEALKATDQLDMPIGLRAQLVEARSYLGQARYPMALERLLHIREESMERELWDTYIKNGLVMADLYETLEQKANALHSLEEIKPVIRSEGLDSLYPTYAIRMASLYWVFDQNEDSLRYYAYEVIRTATQYNQTLSLATGYFLLGKLYGRYPEKAAANYLKSAELFHSIEQYVSESFNYTNVTRSLQKGNKGHLVLPYNDLALVAASKALDSDGRKIIAFFWAYRLRGEIFQGQGQLDSALFYLQKYNELEKEYILKRERNKALEIDALYKDEQKTRQIETQAQKLRFQRQRLIGILFTAGIILLASGVLAYYYWRLQKANRMTIEQSKTINETNKKLTQSLEQQIMLQGEIHHRVKNNLQVIISLMELQKDDIQDEATLNSLDAMASRIYSMAAVHDVLYQKEDGHLVDFLEYTKKLCTYLSHLTVHEKPQINLQIPRQFFNLETLMPLGIILNELLTNSMKYAAQKGRQLLIDIQLESGQDGFYLQYKDNGPGFPEGKLKSRKGGLGTYLLTSMSRQLRGKLETRNEGGAAYAIYFRAKNMAMMDHPS